MIATVTNINIGIYKPRCTIKSILSPRIFLCLRCRGEKKGPPKNGILPVFQALVSTYGNMNAKAWLV